MVVPTINLHTAPRKGITVRKLTLPKYVCKTRTTTPSSDRRHDTLDIDERSNSLPTKRKPPGRNVPGVGDDNSRRTEQPSKKDIAASLFAPIPNASTLRILTDQDDASITMPLQLQQASKELIKRLDDDPRLATQPTGLPSSVVFLNIDFQRRFAKNMRPSRVANRAKESTRRYRSPLLLTAEETERQQDGKKDTLNCNDTDDTITDTFMVPVTTGDRAVEMPGLLHADIFTSSQPASCTKAHTKEANECMAHLPPPPPYDATGAHSSPEPKLSPRQNPFRRFSANSTPRPNDATLDEEERGPAKYYDDDYQPGPLVWEDIEGVFLDLFPTKTDLLHFRKLLRP